MVELKFKPKNLNGGRPRKYKYKGEKKPTTIRLSPEEKKKILNRFENVQEFVQWAIKKLK